MEKVAWKLDLQRSNIWSQTIVFLGCWLSESIFKWQKMWRSVATVVRLPFNELFGLIIFRLTSHSSDLLRPIDRGELEEAVSVVLFNRRLLLHEVPDVVQQVKLLLVLCLQLRRLVLVQVHHKLVVSPWNGFITSKKGPEKSPFLGGGCAILPSPLHPLPLPPPLLLWLEPASREGTAARKTAGWRPPSIDHGHRRPQMSAGATHNLQYLPTSSPTNSVSQPPL